MIRLLPKIMMLAFSAVLSSSPVMPSGIDQLPSGYYAGQSASCAKGLSAGYAFSTYSDVGSWSYDNVFLGFKMMDDIEFHCILPIKEKVEWNGYVYLLTDYISFDRLIVDDYPEMSGVFPGMTYREGLSIFSYFINNGFGSRTIGRQEWFLDGDEIAQGLSLVASYTIDPFVYEGTYTADLTLIGGGEVTVPLVSSMGGCLVGRCVDAGHLDNGAFLLDFYESDYSESVSDVFGVVTDAIGEMGSGLADGVEEATALLYADGSFTTLGILTLLTCGVALVFWAFYLIRKYLHVGVK